MSNNTSSTRKFKSVREQTLDLALDYLERHFYSRHLFPIKARAKFPPLIRDNLSQASNDPAQIKKWHKNFPGCNWGVAHAKSSLLVVDVDTNKTKGKVGDETYNTLEMLYGWPETETTTTPSGGWHMVYEGWADDNHPAHIMALGENGLGRDIDSPNYTLIPGSTFDDGTSYVGNGADAVRCPEWIYDLIKSAKTKSRIADAREVVVEPDQPANIALAIDFLKNDAVPAIEGQNGDLTTFKTAAYLKDIGISQELAPTLLNDYYNPRCVPPWDMDGLIAKVASAFAYTNLSKAGGKTAEADFSDDPPEPITPMGNKRKIAAERKAREQSQEKRRDSFGFDFAHGPNVRMRTIDWIWKDHLALGQHTCIAGVQGDGKSQLVYALAAAVTKGSEWPGTVEKAPLGKVILLNAEDTTEDVMIPRLLAAGADINKVYIVQAVVDKNGKRRKFNLQADLVNLTKLADSLGDVKLITFDPVSSYLGGDLDSHENTHLRDALDPITEMASRTGAAVISVTHFNKSAKGVTALNRVMGGAGFTAAPRAAFAVIRDAKSPLTRMMLSLKSNLAAEGAAYGMCFTLSTKDVGEDERNGSRIVAPYVVWGNKTTMSADEALAANNERLKTPTALNQAIGFLKQMLADGPKLAREVQAAAAKRDIADATLRRARETLDIIAEKLSQRDGRGAWQWSLPDGAITPNDDGRVILPAPLSDPDDEPDFDWPDACDEFTDIEADPVAELM